MNGFQSIESANLTEQFRFPCSKKKRIRNKWAKRPENHRPARHALQMGDKLICHPAFAARLRASLGI
jgi:hypothetical protein